MYFELFELNSVNVCSLTIPKKSNSSIVSILIKREATHIFLLIINCHFVGSEVGPAKSAYLFCKIGGHQR